jgi:hypothetical protein
MKLMAWSLCSAAIATAAMAFCASPARAGLDFTDTATFAGGTVGVVTMVPGSTLIAPGFAGPAAVHLFVAPGIDPVSGFVDFSYSHPETNGGIVAAGYDTDHGSPAFTMVVQFGAISIAPGGRAFLENIFFSEPGSGFGPFNNVHLDLALLSNARVFIKIDPAQVAPGSRDLVNVVRLQFNFTQGTGVTTVDVRAVVNPEPGTVALFGLGLMGLVGAVGMRRRPRTRPKPA